MSIINQQDLMRPLHGAAEFQILWAGVELGIFEILNQRPHTLSELATATGIHEDSAEVQMNGMLQSGMVSEKQGNYDNCPAVQKFFENGEYDIFKKIALIQARIIYLGQMDYVESLKTNSNVGLSRIPGKGNTLYEKLDGDPELRELFYDSMETYSSYAIPLLIEKLDLKDAKNLLDAGGGAGNNVVAMSKAFPHINFTLFDLPHAEKLVAQKFADGGLNGRGKFVAGDLFKDDLPAGHDCITFIHQLPIWGPEENKILLAKALKALNEGGKAVIFSSIGDHPDNLLMSALDNVYFRSVAAGNGKIYPAADYESWLKEVGFSKTETIRCQSWTPHGVVIGYK